MDYELDMQIDPNTLDIEWIEQTSLAMKYGKEFVEAKKVAAQAHENVKVTRARLIKRANKKPDKCLGEGIKPTDAKVEAYYRNHEDHKTAKQELIEAQYEMDLIEIAKNEISFTRKAALENLVKLYTSNYFAGPELPRDLNTEWEEHAKQKSANKKVKLTRKK